MEERIVEVDGVRLVVTKATLKQGIKRTRLRVEGQKLAKAGELEDVDEFLLRMYTWPDLMAATVSADGIEWPLTFAAFLELPDTLGAKWEAAVYELNPDWLPSSGEDAAEKEAEKNV